MLLPGTIDERRFNVCDDVVLVFHVDCLVQWNLIQPEECGPLFSFAWHVEDDRGVVRRCPIEVWVTTTRGNIERFAVKCHVDVFGKYCRGQQKQDNCRDQY